MKTHPRFTARAFARGVNRRVGWLACVALGAALGSAPAPAAAASAASRPPNIIYLLADDLGYGDLGSYGQKLIRTPRLDQMAREGMRFTQHYAGAPSCHPSRCVLFTG